MDSTKNNPQTNTLGPGVDDKMVTDAIKASGYPLQLTVANLLSSKFRILEEWSYPDTDAQTVRTIDIVATREFEWREPQPRARPALSFVIECKQSDLPYVFFLSEVERRIRDFPLIAGLKDRYIHITTDDDPSSWGITPIGIFDLWGHSFVTTDVPHCMTFSKCVRQGRNFVLSGSDAYQGIIFPITEAMQHLKADLTPPSTARYFDCVLIIGLAVIDAPLVGVRVIGSNLETVLMPWIRIVRHHPSHSKDRHDRIQTLGIEIIHKDFVVTYMEQHALPFAQRFADLALKHHNVLADSRGFVSGMGRDSWTNIEARLTVANVITKGKRVRATFRRNQEQENISAGRGRSPS